MSHAEGSKNKTIAVTGCSGYVASRLVESLCRDDRVERVLGFDVAPCSFRDPKFVFDVVDVRNPAIEARLAGVDVLVHLAFVMDPIKDESRMRDVNVNGSQNVFRCAGRAGAEKIVYTSSAVVYGAHPDNDIPLGEDSPLRANLDFSYAAHKLEVEYVVREIRDEFPGVTVVDFRPCIILGPNVDSAWSRILEMPLIVGVRGHRPPFQFVHEEDVAAALAFAVHADLDGPYNLAPDDRLTSDEVVETLARRRIELPEAAAFAAVDRMWSLGLSEAPAGMLHYVMYPWIIAPDRLEKAGFRVRYSSRESLLSAAERLRSHVRIGRSRVRKGDVVRGAVAGVGVIGAAFTLRLARRRRLPARA